MALKICRLNERRNRRGNYQMMQGETVSLGRRQGRDQ